MHIIPKSFLALDPHTSVIKNFWDLIPLRCFWPSQGAMDVMFACAFFLVEEICFIWCLLFPSTALETLCTLYGCSPSPTSLGDNVPVGSGSGPSGPLGASSAGDELRSSKLRSALVSLEKRVRWAALGMGLAGLAWHEADSGPKTWQAGGRKLEKGWVKAWRILRKMSNW